MSTQPAFRQILAVIAGVAATGTMLELALIGHWHGPLQLIPWAVAYATMTAAWATATPTGTRRLQLARWLSTLNIIGGALGSAVHLQANQQFAAEIHPAASTVELMARAAQGRIPLLAPLVLALPSVLVLVAAWRHPDDQARQPTRVGRRFGAVGSNNPPIPTHR